MSSATQPRCPASYIRVLSDSGDALSAGEEDAVKSFSFHLQVIKETGQKPEGDDVTATTGESGSCKNQGDRDEAEDVTVSLKVGDGRYVVDLGSSSESVVDEECLLELFQSCRRCERRCAIRKRVRGLKLELIQKCRFCQSCWKWTNLPDPGEECLQKLN